MDPIALGLILASYIILAVIAIIYFRRLKDTTKRDTAEALKREKELRRRVFELQVLKTLEERVGYSLNLTQILGVITDSLKGLVDFAAVSYMLLGPEGKVVLKVRVEQPVSRLFLTQAKEQMLKAFTEATKKNIQPELVEETVSGNLLDERSSLPVGSLFHLPIVIGGRVVALVSVFSPKTGLYADEDTAVLYNIMGQVSIQANKLAQVVENEERKLSAMVSSLTDGVLMVDRGYNLLVANSAVGKLLGLTEGVSLHQVAAVLGSQVDLYQSIQKAMEHQTIIKVPEFETQAHAIQIDVEPVKDHYGYMLGVVVVIHDATEHRNLERMREDFIGLMIHQLRTPLTTISYSTNMMLSDMPKIALQQVEQNIQIISSTAQGMLSLVNDLLDVSRIEAGKLMVIKQPGDLGKLIIERVEEVKSEASSKHLLVSTEVDPDLARVPFDKVRLTQALDHVLSNAVRFTEAGEIKIAARLDQDQVVITIADTGEGIKATDLPKLFSKFEQFNKDKQGEKVGTGLGLLITKGIIEAHGGKIKVESSGENQGTTVTLTLPME